MANRGTARSKEARDKKWESIKPYLNNEQIKMLERLQLADVGLLVAFPKYEDRMRYLDRYKTMILEGEV